MHAQEGAGAVVRGGDLLLLALAWCGGQLALFACLRLLRPLRSEGAIFALHVAAFAAFAVLCAVSYSLYQGVTFTVAIGALALNAIYCLSFLELWSLAEGGYSIGLLKSLTGGPRARSAVAAELATVGDRKRDNRIVVLQDLGLVSSAGGTLALTPRGRPVAAAIALLRALANFRKPG